MSMTNKDLIEYLEQFPANAEIVEHHWSYWPDEPGEIIWYDENSNKMLY